MLFSADSVVSKGLAFSLRTYRKDDGNDESYRDELRIYYSSRHSELPELCWFHVCHDSFLSLLSIDELSRLKGSLIS